MVQRNMEKEKPGYRKNLEEILIILFVIVMSGLLITQVVINVLNEVCNK